MVGEMVARNDLIVLNRGRNITLRRGGEGAIIDLTFAAPRLASRIGDWCVLDVITFSDHHCIELSIPERSHLVNTGRGGKVRSPSWNTKRLSSDMLREHLEETQCTGGTTSCLSSVENSLPRGGDLGDPLLRKAWKRANSALRQGIKKSRLQSWKDLIGEVEKDP